jgi:hypothetical protein
MSQAQSKLHEPGTKAAAGCATLGWTGGSRLRRHDEVVFDDKARLLCMEDKTLDDLGGDDALF